MFACAMVLFVCLLTLSFVESRRCPDLRRHTRTVVNRETGLRVTSCPANRTASVVPTSALTTDTTLAFLLMAASSPDYVSSQAAILEASHPSFNASGPNVCQATNLDPSLAPELRSDCPFDWTKNVRPDRFPEVLMEARCLCNQSRSSKVACQKVTSRIPVLWREHCSLKVHRYRLGFETIAVACVASFGSPPLAGALLDVVHVTRTP